jgi:hypothetical protein
LKRRIRKCRKRGRGVKRGRSGRGRRMERMRDKVKYSSHITQEVTISH